MRKRYRLSNAILRLIAKDVNKEPDMLGNRDIGLLSPTYFKQALNEAIEVLPDESRLMIGGDNWHVKETYGAIQLMRRLIGEVLQEKVESGYFRAEDGRRLARRILHENAAQFFDRTVKPL